MNGDLLLGLDKLESILGDGSTWTKHVHYNCLAKAAGQVDNYYGHNTTRLQGELCKTLNKSEHYGWLIDFNDHPSTTFADVKKLIADTRTRILSSASTSPKE